MHKIQINKASVFFEAARNCKNVSVTSVTVVGNAWSQALQTTVSAQPIRENGGVNITTHKFGGSLISSKDFCHCFGCSACYATVIQLDLEAWPQAAAKRTAMIFIQGVCRPQC
jgi:hypothetical protein